MYIAITFAITFYCTHQNLIEYYKLDGFIKLDQEEIQMKEIYFLFGFCISRFSILDNYFIPFLKHNKVNFEGVQLGKTLSGIEIDKIKKHYDSKATLGMLINEFKTVFDTDEVGDLFKELVRVRNIVVHPYMKVNSSQLHDKKYRVEIYQDLLTPLDFLDHFDETLKGKPFRTRKNKDFAVRYNPKH